MDTWIMITNVGCKECEIAKYQIEKGKLLVNLGLHNLTEDGFWIADEYEIFSLPTFINPDTKETLTKQEFFEMYYEAE